MIGKQIKYLLILSLISLVILDGCSKSEPFYQSMKITSTDSTISYLTIDTLNTNCLTNGFTWEMWFRIGEVTLDAPCLFMVPDENRNNDLAVFIDRDTGMTINAFYANQQFTASTGVNLLDGQFHSIALADSSQGRLVLFVDGSKRMTRTHSLSLSPTGRDILIGGDWDPGQSKPDNGWTGWIDEIRIWDAALPDSELTFHGKHIDKLTQHYNPDFLSHLKVLWRFNTTDNSLALIADEHPGSGERPNLIPSGKYSWSESATR